MNLYFLRHASAGVRRKNPLLDVKRPIDREGKQHCLELAHVMNALKINFDLIVSSPLKRSLQTASLLATETGYEAAILQTKCLEPEATMDDFQQLLKEVRDRENILLVGHNPNLTQFLGALLVPHGPRQKDAPIAMIRLRKGALGRVSITQGPAVLMSLLDPRTVKALYATSTKSSRRKTSKK
ncbi:histidine phosphatase family protein [Granulicella sp. WH15]|uniref:SixA phosphatase family protein n=1 Tax=Granulicella sp. WH15 TaxID=2602070 RepID=UPI0013671A2D|nr:phosphoglycerate mutase family protein [Granulicella sp. WH15]QHN02223.1 histidine phosphatase family protein [Granulicella sp. WH15]